MVFTSSRIAFLATTLLIGFTASPSLAFGFRDIVKEATDLGKDQLKNQHELRKGKQEHQQEMDKNKLVIEPGQTTWVPMNNEFTEFTCPATKTSPCILVLPE